MWESKARLKFFKLFYFRVNVARFENLKSAKNSYLKGKKEELLVYRVRMKSKERVIFPEHRELVIMLCIKFEIGVNKNQIK